MAVLIIAASKSDIEAMKKATDTLDKNGIKWKLHVCSAHRTPYMLDRIMGDADGFDAIIAGAGLAAALPGVVAAKTTVPVIGVPLTGAFEGLDALLSIIQMPPGIPVITAGVNNAEEAAKTAAMIAASKACKANIVTANSKSSKAVQKASELLKNFGIPYSCTGRIEKGSINLAFVDINEKEFNNDSEALTICCPTTEKESAADALKLLQLTRKGAWVGLNRGENAAIAAAEIMKLTDNLTEHRKEMRRIIEEADREANR